MTTNIDHQMAQVAHLLWPQPLHIDVASGGLFNRVLKVSSSKGTSYLKRFTDAASSGSFPPLPTTANQRCLVACSWHDAARRASSLNIGVSVPALTAIHTELDLLAMDEVAGTPLYDALIADGKVGQAALIPLIRWLGVLHTLSLEPRDALLAASRPFKQFKIDLQYTRVLNDVPSGLHRNANEFIDAYLKEESEAVHGDLNSRNVLVEQDDVAVIDFEQGHFGEGIYDLAYILSEYVIQALMRGDDPVNLIESAWSTYADARGWNISEVVHLRFRIHLAFQTLYRLVGPSRKVWTGHLDDDACARVRTWSVGELEKWL